MLLPPVAKADDHGRFWDHYKPMPSGAIGSREWWHGDAALGDWWGLRNRLYEEGVDFSLTYTGNFAANPVGGHAQGAAYSDNISFGFELHLQKLIGWNGASLTVSAANRDGQSLSEKYIQNEFNVKQTTEANTLMYYKLALTQKLFDDRLNIKIGRFAAGEDFTASPIYWYYMNGGINGNQLALPVNSDFSVHPWASWAARLRMRPTPETDIKFGVYQVSTRIFDKSYHGLDWSIRSGDGVILLSQIGWSPQLFKQRASAGKKTSPQHIASPSSPPADGETLEGMPGHYWVGFYFSPWSFKQIGATDLAQNLYGFYGHADQMIYQEMPNSDQGLILWAAGVCFPQQNVAKLPVQIEGGLLYKGLIPGRDEDESIFGILLGSFSKNFSDTAPTVSGSSPQYEMILELGYRLQTTKFSYIQPNVQVVINPGGYQTVPSALVLGAQVGVAF